MVFPKRVISLDGYRFTLHGLAESDPYFAGLNDNPDPEFLELCRQLVAEDAVCIDIGANIGVKSLFLSRHCPAGRVIAIEAAPTVADCLAMNIAANEATNVTIEQIAIGGCAGKGKFVQASAYGHLGDRGIDVEVTTLPALIDRLNLDRVDFVKIDVEGFELPILQSALDAFNRFETLVLLEMNAWCQIVYSNVNPREFAEWTLNHFSHVFRLRREGSADTLLDRIGKEDLLRLLRQNIMVDQCVTDLLVTNAPRRLIPSAASLIRQLDKAIAERDAALGERDAAVAERDAARKERDALVNSTSWRITQPLRQLAELLPRQ